MVTWNGLRGNLDRNLTELARRFHFERIELIAIAVANTYPRRMAYNSSRSAAL